jgi:archaellum component FlaC
MAESSTAGIFESYNTALKSWSDMMGSWTRKMEDFSGAFNPSGNSNGFGWISLGKTFTEMMDRLPLPYGPMKNMNETLAKSLDSSRKIYDSYLKNMMAVIKERYEIDLKSVAGDDPETDRFFDAIHRAYEDISATAVESLKDTPFEGVKEIDDAVRQSLETLSEERQMVRALFKEITAFKAQVAKLSSLAMKEAASAVTDVKEKGTLSVDACKEMADACGNTLNRSLEIFGLPDPLTAEYKNAVNGAVRLAEKNLDVFTAWLEINLKSTRAMTGCAEDVCKFTEEIFKESKEGKVPSQEVFYKKCADVCEESLRKLVKGTHFNGSIPRFIEAYTDYLKSVRGHYRKIMVIPYGINMNLPQERTEMKAE